MVKVLAETAEICMSSTDYYYQRDLQAFRDVMCEVLNLDKMDITSQYRSDANRRVVELCTVPNLPLPSALTSFLGIDKLIMTDIITMPATNAGPTYALGYSLRTPVYPDKVSTIGTMTITQVSSGSCKMSMDCDVEVNIWGWGSMIESIVSGAINNGYLKMADAAVTWRRRRAWLRFFHRLGSGVRLNDPPLRQNDGASSPEPGTPATCRSIRSSPAGTFCSMNSEEISERMRDLEGFQDDDSSMLPEPASGPWSTNQTAGYEDCQDRTVRFNGVTTARTRDRSASESRSFIPERPSDSVAIHVGSRTTADDSSSDSEDSARKKGDLELDELRQMRARLALLEQQVSKQTGIKMPKMPKLTTNQKMVIAVILATMFITWNMARFMHPW